MALALATSSPFKKSHISNNMAYYFDDNRIAIVEANNGEWKSIQTSITNSSDESLDQRMVIHYHQRYVRVSNLEQDINVDIGLKYGLHLALLDYVRMRLEEDGNDLQRSNYYFGRFNNRIKRYPYRKAAVRGIQMYNLT